MRIFSAGVSTETNTFAPWPTGQRAFDEGGYWPGTASASGNSDINLVARLFRRLAEEGAHEFVEGLFAYAESSGPTIQAVYERLRKRILDDLVRKGPFDVVLLYLHGAMVATNCDDCEADLVAHIRDVVGTQTVVGVELDCHCHLSQTLVDLCDIVILMKEFPHTDFEARASELYELCLRKRAGRISPTSYIFDCRMVGIYPTTSDPMSGFVERLRLAERRTGVLSASFAHGYPWGDTYDTGSKVLVITNGDIALASEVSTALGHEVYELRNRLMPRYPSIDEALDLATAAEGRVVLADTADNAGGGAPSDNVSLLAAMLQRKLADAAFGAIWDPIAVRTCVEAGLNTTFYLRLGGKCSQASGSPIDVEVTVRGIKEDHEQAGLGDSRVPMGLSVWLKVGGIDVVLSSIRTQIFGPDAFTGLGVEFTGKRIIAVKSTQHFQQHFSRIADRIIHVATPGALQMRFSEIRYRKIRDQNYFPRVPDPLGSGRA